MSKYRVNKNIERLGKLISHILIRIPYISGENPTSCIHTLFIDNHHSFTYSTSYAMSFA